MSSARNTVCAMLLAAVAAVPLSAWVSGDGGPLSPKAGHGVVGGVIAQLKAEDDETEARENAEYRPEREELEQAREQAEGARLEEAAAEERERPSPPEPS